MDVPDAARLCAEERSPIEPCERSSCLIATAMMLELAPIWVHWHDVGARHVGVVQSGRIAVQHEDGTELELGPGDAYIIEPGHDAWVVGDERFVGFEFESRSAEEYAKS